MMRAGGRCARPGCDKPCWLPADRPSSVATIGVAAHICAASPGGPRYDVNQSPDERSDIENGIYLCETCATLIDRDPGRFPASELRAWKAKHEAQVKDEASGDLLMPTITVRATGGMKFDARTSRVVTSETMGNARDFLVTVTNVTDFIYETFGFDVQFPEYVEDEPQVDGPPGLSHKVRGEGMEWEIITSGGGRAEVPRRTHYRSFNIEFSALRPREVVEVKIRSVPDPQVGLDDGEIAKGKIVHYISGGVRVRIGGILREQTFTVPLKYDQATRRLTAEPLGTIETYFDRVITIRRM